MGNSGELVKTHLIGLFAKGENRGRSVIVRVQTYVEFFHRMQVPRIVQITLLNSLKKK